MTIYVLRSGHLVKIGFTEQLRTRISSYRSSTPQAEFVGHMPGDMAVEQHLHNKFAATHFSGEWYVETEEMTSVFKAILDPDLPELRAEKAQKRRDTTDIPSLSENMRKSAAERWPTESIGARIKLAADELDWTINRVRDVFYADERIAIRASEQEQIARWIGVLASETAESEQ